MAEIYSGGSKGQRPDYIVKAPEGRGSEGPVIKKCLLSIRIGGELGRTPSPGEVMGLHLPVFREEACLDKVRPPRGGPVEEEPTDSQMGEKARPVQEAHPFVLSEALPVVPSKLVQRILKGEYVDMAEFLKDNAEVERRRLTAGESGQTPRACRREITDFESWMLCFSAYATVVCARYPHKARELWAYQALMIAEHHNCGGRGWLLYDCAFRQQISLLESADFSKVNQSLYATTFLAYGGRGQFCVWCMASDHAQEECALHPNREVPVVQLQDHRLGRLRREEQALGDQRRRRGRRGACYAYNDGRCTTPFCRFEHVC